MSETPEQYNAKVIGEFRANGGRVGDMWEGTPLLLLHHTGARSGVSRVNPVAYLPDAGRYFIWAANGGAPRHPAWYHNLKERPVTRIEVGGETIDVVAEEATDQERERLFAKAAERYPQLADIAGKTERIIPLVVLTPNSNS
jgi:deazaflavin-dependent oxidoreductase (nitroreductase family)